MGTKATRISLNDVTKHFDENADLCFQGETCVHLKTLVKLYGEPDAGYHYPNYYSWGLRFPDGTVALIEGKRNDKKRFLSVETLDEFNVFGRCGEQKALLLVLEDKVFEEIRSVEKKGRISVAIGVLLFIAVFTAWAWASIYSGGMP